MDSKNLASLARFGKTQGASITKAAVLYSLGAALFCAENARQVKPLPRNDRRAKYEGTDHGRATERHWLLGVTLAARCKDALAQVLAEANQPDASAMVDRFGAMVKADALADGHDVADSAGRLVWAKVDAWAKGAKAEGKVPDYLASAGKALDKYRDIPATPDARREAAKALDAFMVKVRDMAKALRAEADALDVMTLNEGVAPDTAGAVVRDIVAAALTEGEGEAAREAA